MFSFLNEKTTDFSQFLQKFPMAVFAVLTFCFIILRLCIPMEPLFLLLFIISCLLIFLNVTKKLNNFMMIFLFAAMVLGIYATGHAIDKNEDIVDRFGYETVRVNGEITSVPTNNSSFFLKVKNISSIDGNFKESFTVFMTADISADLKLGDNLTFNCELYEPEIINTELSNYFLAKGAPLLAENVTVLGIEKNKSHLNFVTNLRNYIIDLGHEFLSGDVCGMFCALTAGDKTEFSKELVENLSKSGLSHMACVSGLHVSILGMAVYNLLIKRKRWVAATVSVAVVYLFALITGATPSTMRAAIMFTCFIVAKMTLYENHSFTALSVSAMFLAVLNPYVIFDWGFILSYLSVLGIEVFSKFIKRFFKFLPDILADSISITIAAQTMTLPAVTNIFGYLPVYSVFANIIISIVFVYALYICFLFIPIGIIPFVNNIAAIFCGCAIEIILAVTKFFAELPFSTAGVGAFDVYEIICYYIIILMFVFRKNLSEYFIGVGMLLCSALLLISGYAMNDKLEKYSLSDDSILYLADGLTVLEADWNIIDASDSLKEWRKVDNIDYLVVRNWVRNQENGLIELDNYADVSVIYIPEEYKNITFERIAYKIGVECEYYNGESEEVIDNLIGK